MPPTTTLLRQAGVIPVQNGRVCVVTSRNGKRWVIPKGCMEPGMTAGEVALQEAWEEAGLVGTLSPEPVGSYFYEKAGMTCVVVVFLMNVTAVTEDWPERFVRERVWLTPNQAALRLEDPTLQELIREISPRTAR
jgi:8-oxo-dGTP pyrophosphatase MutT (NUDIX family)